MGAVGLLFRAEARHRWRSRLALAALIALVGGLVLAAGATERRGKRRPFAARGPITPRSLVNFGEAVNFPLFLGAVLGCSGRRRWHTFSS